MFTSQTHTTTSFGWFIRSAAWALLATGCIGKDSPPDRLDLRKCRASGTICTVAGTGVSGYNVQDQQALDTNLSQPNAVDIGADGLLLVNDSLNFLVRQLRGDGVLESVAGSHASVTAVEGVPALESGLNVVSDIAVGPSGMIYLVESQSARILGLDLTASEPEFEILVGSIEEFETIDEEYQPPVLLDMRQPSGIAVSSTGRLYISDVENPVIWGVDLDDGVGGAVAGVDGDGYANDFFSEPQRMAINDGGLYVADSGNHAVARVDLATFDTEWVAGISTGDGHVPWYGGDGYPLSYVALTPSQLEESAEGVYEITGTGLNAPYAVSFTPDGRMLIADSGNDAIRAVMGDGNVDTVVGRGPSGYDGDEGPAENASVNFPSDIVMGGDGQVFIADSTNAVIRWIAAPTF